MKNVSQLSVALYKAVKIIVDSQAQFPDQNKHDDIKFTLNVDLIILLYKFVYHPTERDEVYVEVFKQGASRN